MWKLPCLWSRAGSDFIVRGMPAACRPDCPATRRIDSECPAYVDQARVAWARQVQAVANPPRYPEEPARRLRSNRVHAVMGMPCAARNKPAALLCAVSHSVISAIEAYARGKEGGDAALIGLLRLLWAAKWKCILSIIEPSPQSHGPLCCSYSGQRNVLACARRDSIVEQ